MATLSSRVYTQKTSDAGTSLFASDAIPPGVEILRVERPLVCVLDTAHLQDTCSECNLWFPETGHVQRSPSERLKTCLGCKITRYCCKVRFFFLFSSFFLRHSMLLGEAFTTTTLPSSTTFSKCSCMSISKYFISFVSSTLFVSSHTQSSNKD